MTAQNYTNAELMPKSSKIFSNYYHRNTTKALAGIAPSGKVTFVSDSCTSRSKDKQIT